MFHKTIAIVCALGILSGCAGQVSSETQAALNLHLAQCQAGNQDACGTARLDQYQADRERDGSATQQNSQGAAIAAGFLGLLLGAAIEANSQPTYVIVPRRRW